MNVIERFPAWLTLPPCLANRERDRRRPGFGFAAGFVLLCWLVLGGRVETVYGQEVDPAALSGFDESEIGLLRDEEFESLDDEFIRRLLYRVQRTKPELLRTAADQHGILDWETLKGNPADYRFWVVAVKARVRHVSRIRSGVTMRADIPYYYQCLLEDQHGNRATVLTLEVPSLWAGKSTLDEPVECDAFFVGALTEALGGQKPDCLFVANRLRWRPDQDRGLGLSAGVLELARNGFDLALLDVIYRNERRSLTADENQAFYAMLRATERVIGTDPEHSGYLDSITPENAESAGPKSSAPAGLIDLIRRPARRTGDRTRIAGRVVQVVPVFADDGRTADLARPSYYQVHLSVALGNKQVAIEGPDQERLVFRDRFPVTVIFPERLMGEADGLKSEMIDVSGFMYRFWNYQSVFAEEMGVSTGQYSPLIFADDFRVISGPDDVGSLILPGILLGLLTFIVIFAFWVGQGDRRSFSQRRASRLPEAIQIPKENEKGDSGEHHS